MAKESTSCQKETKGASSRPGTTGALSNKATNLLWRFAIALVSVALVFCYVWYSSPVREPLWSSDPARERDTPVYEQPACPPVVQKTPCVREEPAQTRSQPSNDASLSTDDAPILPSLPPPTFDTDVEGADQVPEEQIKDVLNRVQESLEIFSRIDTELYKTRLALNQVVVTTSIPESYKRITGKEAEDRDVDLLVAVNNDAERTFAILLDLNKIQNSSNVENIATISHELYRASSLRWKKRSYVGYIEGQPPPDELFFRLVEVHAFRMEIIFLKTLRGMEENPEIKEQISAALSKISPDFRELCRLPPLD